MDTQEKVRENYYRRMAKRQNLWLKKSRAKRWSVDNQLGYMIMDPYVNTIVYGVRFNLSLDEVAKFLEDYEQEIRQGATVID